jgi:hypothetical protein
MLWLSKMRLREFFNSIGHPKKLRTSRECLLPLRQPTFGLLRGCAIRRHPDMAASCKGRFKGSAYGTALDVKAVSANLLC